MAVRAISPELEGRDGGCGQAAAAFGRVEVAVAEKRGRLSGEQICKWTPNVEVTYPPELRDPEVTDYVQEHFWHSTEQFGIADDGFLLLTMRVAINPELEGKIRKWTPNVEVINPPELRDTFRKHAAKEYERYH